MVKKKPQSKRRTLQEKYKIEKRVRQHHKKQRREAKKNAGKRKLGKLDRDPGIPNLWPYKEELLAKIEAKRERDEQAAMDAKKAKREEAKRKRAGPTADELAVAAAMSGNFDHQYNDHTLDENSGDGVNSGKDGEIPGEDSFEVGSSVGHSKRQYMKELRQVVESSDVILEVLDARDPMGCRAKELETMVVKHPSGKKRLVLVLNKIDLVPNEIVLGWMEVLKLEFPTIAFKASTQEQRSNLGSSSSVSALDMKSTTSVGQGVCLGGDALLQLLKNYSRNRNMKTAITAGVVGYPNVGKSSLINSLKRSRAVSVSPTPGQTKNLQVVMLDKKVKLIDSPGVLFAGKGDSDSLALRNCLDPATLEDPLGTVEVLIQKCKPEQLLRVFKVARFSTPSEFIRLVARKYGKMTKKGMENTDAAAKIILQYWNQGKIPFFTIPPVKQLHELRNEAAHAENSLPSTKIIREWSQEFGLDQMENGQISTNEDDDQENVEMETD